MIEKIILDFLSENLPIPVYMELPADLPEAFVHLEKTGSGRRNRIYTATVAVRSYGKTLFNAAEINEMVKAVMDTLINLDDVSRVDLNTDYPFDDTTRKRHRYQAVFDITHY